MRSTEIATSPSFNEWKNNSATGISMTEAHCVHYNRIRHVLTVSLPINISSLPFISFPFSSSISSSNIDFKSRTCTNGQPRGPILFFHKIAKPTRPNKTWQRCITKCCCDIRTGNISRDFMRKKKMRMVNNLKDWKNRLSGFEKSPRSDAR